MIRKFFSLASGLGKVATRKAKLRKRYIYFFALLSIGVIFVFYYFPLKENFKLSNNEMVAAAEKMRKAEQVIRSIRREKGPSINPTFDPNLTGLIGKEYTELTTTLGDLEAKRTTTNPNFAGLMVRLMRRAGVKVGDRVAVGASGSFPAAAIASLIAAEQIGARPVIIYSLGSSMWGANMINLTILDMHNILLEEDIISVEVAAASIGGEDDIGRGLDEEIRNRLKEKIRESDCDLIYTENLRENVNRRMEIYKNSSDSDIQAFVNTGGALANMGTSAEILHLRPGINIISDLPPVKKRGVVFAMASNDVPIINILNIKGLGLRYRLPWDPTPLPSPGEGKMFDRHEEKPFIFWLVFYFYFGLLLTGIVLLKFYR